MWEKVKIKPSEWKVSELSVHPGLVTRKEKRKGRESALHYLLFISCMQAPVRSSGQAANVAASVPVPGVLINVIQTAFANSLRGGLTQS